MIKAENLPKTPVVDVEISNAVEGLEISIYWWRNILACYKNVV